MGFSSFADSNGPGVVRGGGRSQRKAGRLRGGVMQIIPCSPAFKGGAYPKIIMRGGVCPVICIRGGAVLRIL